jgi:hypothetical protein
MSNKRSTPSTRRTRIVRPRASLPPWCVLLQQALRARQAGAWPEVGRGCCPSWPRPQMCPRRTRRRCSSRLGASCKPITGHTRRKPGMHGRAQLRMPRCPSRSWRR